MKSELGKTMSETDPKSLEEAPPKAEECCNTTNNDNDDDGEMIGGMERRIRKAARSWDLDLWSEIVKEYGAVANPNANAADDYYSPLFSQFVLKNRYSSSMSAEAGNILHHAAACTPSRAEFFRVAQKSLPPHILHSLFSQRQPITGGNCLHAAASTNFDILKLILDFYKSYKVPPPRPMPTKVTHISQMPPHPHPPPRPTAPPRPTINVPHISQMPWAAQNHARETPLHRAFSSGRTESDIVEIMEYLSKLDHIDCVSTHFDSKGRTPLFLAVDNGYNQVADHILKSLPDCDYSLPAQRLPTPLHVVYKSTESIYKQLLDKYPKLINVVDEDGQTVVHKWVEAGMIWPLECALDKPYITDSTREALFKHIHTFNDFGQNPFHMVAEKGIHQVSTTLVKFYNNHNYSTRNNVTKPWLALSGNQETAVDLAAKKYLASNHTIDSSTQYMIKCIIEGDYDPLFQYIKSTTLCTVAKESLAMVRKFGWTHGGNNILNDAFAHSDSEVTQWVVENFPETVSELENNDLTIKFSEAIERGYPWFVKAALDQDSAETMLRGDWRRWKRGWIKACERGDLTTVYAFFDNRHAFSNVRYARDTPLHHIRLQTCEEYKTFLNHPVVRGLMINYKNRLGSTPLHTSISSENIHLTEALLSTKEVLRNIKNNSGKTAMKLLLKKAHKNKNWVEMCKRVGITPGFKTTYFQDQTNLLNVRDTLSVVAAILATITFTAGFTLPGSVQSDSTGKPILGNKPAFLVFLVADTIAMCFSMLVLICLVWSMTEPEKSLLLINSSMDMLLMALYSTTIAFMTGIYVVIPHKSIWVAIVVLIICSIFMILSIKKVLCMLIDLRYRLTGYNYKEEVQKTKEGETRQGEEKRKTEQGEEKRQGEETRKTEQGEETKQGEETRKTE